PNVGFIVRITPRDAKTTPFPDLARAEAAELIRYLSDPNPVLRFHSQKQILGRASKAEFGRAFVELAANADAPLHGRPLAIVTLKQLDGMASQSALLKLAEIDAVREFALRALTDRLHELAGLNAKPFVTALADKNPRVQAQALISLGRLGNATVAKSI